MPKSPKTPRVSRPPWRLKEAADALNMSLSTLYRCMDAGQIKYIRIGKCRAIPDDEIQRLQTEGMQLDAA
jgi:excisionase family DNA binding protein